MHVLITFSALLIPFSALCIAAAAITFTVITARQRRNADLVSIGVAILRADPKNESQVMPAREWALDLIDANTGGVKFSQAARNQLLRHSLSYVDMLRYAEPPPELTVPCKPPVELPAGDLSAGAVQRLWARDRAELVSCGLKHEALVEFYRALSDAAGRENRNATRHSLNDSRNDSR